MDSDRQQAGYLNIDATCLRQINFISHKSLVLLAVGQECDGHECDVTEILDLFP